MVLRKFYSVFGLMVLSVASVCAKAPVGKWITVDDKTGQKRSEVFLSLAQDELSGRIIAVYKQAGDTGICQSCPGEFKDKPIENLKFLWGLKESKDGSWDGGKILDPKTGKIYHARMTEKGNKLYVRGYVGMPLLGRTQIWVRP